MSAGTRRVSLSSKAILAAGLQSVCRGEGTFTQYASLAGALVLRYWPLERLPGDGRLRVAHPCHPEGWRYNGKPLRARMRVV